MNKTIFIDRDGVINRDLWRYVEHWDEFEFLPRVLDGFRLLNEYGYACVIVSNQAGIGDGKYTKEALDDIHKNMCAEIEKAGGNVAASYFCLHGKQDGCSCRKPEIGLFEQAELELPDFDNEQTYFIGDKLSDVEAGKRFGIKTALVLTGYGEKSQSDITPDSTPDIVADDFYHAVEMILKANGEFVGSL